MRPTENQLRERRERPELDAVEPVARRIEVGHPTSGSMDLIEDEGEKPITSDASSTAPIASMTISAMVNGAKSGEKVLCPRPPGPGVAGHHTADDAMMNGFYGCAPPRSHSRRRPGSILG